jgi:hypothetical protein
MPHDQHVSLGFFVRRQCIQCVANNACVRAGLPVGVGVVQACV